MKSAIKGCNIRIGEGPQPEAKKTTFASSLKSHFIQKDKKAEWKSTKKIKKHTKGSEKK